jgi:hypothetical protein
VAALDDKSRLDAEVCPEAGQLCTMRRFAPGTEDVHGENADRGWSTAFITTTFGSSFRWAQGLLRGGREMIGSRYKRVGDKRRPDTYAVIGPSSEIGSVREWILQNEKDETDEVIVAATDLENQKIWEQLD